ncbi:calcium-transporting ATPase 12, plasma membrane-type-like [Camellia sinensis]|uniref:calcium-transporting ATPase 12, plasma membrane-type-like n=1 Tax=Camellia sinensis TaxID=4442 RepID=UPI001036F274|nr:calcium-transporting ATPase 12, plasma membrane-type-like [Camellia sinensis]
MENSPTENQINTTLFPPIPIWNIDEQYEAGIPNFKIAQERLSELVHANDIHGIAAALETNIDAGISGDVRDLHRRHRAFGPNLNFEDQSSLVAKGFYQILLEAFKNTTVILLLCCAMLSLAIGIKRNGLQEGFRDGAIIFLAIFIVVNVGCICRFFKAKRMRKLARDRKVEVVVMRNSKTQQISASEIVVGDILRLKTGDRVSADGLLIDGGDSFNLDDDLVHDHHSPMFTGAKVMGGQCRVLVTSVGKNTEKSKLMRSIRSFHQAHEESKLQISIDKTNSRLEKVWLSLSLLVLLVQLLRCFTGRPGCDQNHNPDPKGVKNTVAEIMNEATKLMKKKEGAKANGLVAMLCILLFSIRDGLPLGIFISFKYATKKMLPYQALVRKLPACAKIGLVTTVCTGETSDLTLQHSKMAELWIGLDSINEVFMGEVIDILREGLGMNLSGGGGQGEHGLLIWAKQVLGVDIEELNRSRTVLCTEAFDVEKNRSGLSLRRNGEEGKVVHVHWKGGPEVVLSMCSHYYDAFGTKQTLDEQKRALFNKIIERFASDSLQCFAFAYKKVVKEEKEKDLELEDEEEKEDEEEEAIEGIKEHGLTLLGMVSFKNPYAPEVRRAVKECQESGVAIKLVVGENINTAKFIAINSGILKHEHDHEKEMNGTVIEASQFRHSSEEDRMNMIDHIVVMANSSPADKLLLLQCLKQKGEVVAATGISTRDSPSLEAADVGLAVGDNAAELAKESSDIVILDRSFVTIFSIIKFGRCVCNNLRKFVQLQLTLNIVAFIINFIVVVCISDDEPIGPFQLMWVNLVMDILGALALAEPLLPSQTLQREAEDQDITMTVWRNIVVQTLYQITVLLVLYFKGKALLNTKLKPMIFNCYLLCQVFVLINAREIKKPNVFKGMTKHKNCWFLAGAVVVLQIAVMEIYMVVVIHWERLDLIQWCICFGIAALSLPLGWIAKKTGVLLPS